MPRPLTSKWNAPNRQSYLGTTLIERRPTFNSAHFGGGGGKNLTRRNYAKWFQVYLVRGAVRGTCCLPEWRELKRVGGACLPHSGVHNGPQMDIIFFGAAHHPAANNAACLGCLLRLIGQGNLSCIGTWKQSERERELWKRSPCGHDYNTTKQTLSLSNWRIPEEVHQKAVQLTPHSETHSEQGCLN